MGFIDLGQVGVFDGRLQGTVTQISRDQSDAHALFKQMGGIGMTQGMRAGPSSTVKEVVLLIFNGLGFLKGVFLHYILDNFGSYGQFEVHFLE
jgi:hypothetical protein